MVKVTVTDQKTLHVNRRLLNSVWISPVFLSLAVNVPMFADGWCEGSLCSPHSAFSSWGPRAAQDARSCPQASGTESSPRTWWATAPAFSGSWCTARKIQTKLKTRIYWDTTSVRSNKNVPFSRPTTPVMNGTKCLSLCPQVSSNCRKYPLPLKKNLSVTILQCYTKLVLQYCTTNRFFASVVLPQST